MLDALDAQLEPSKTNFIVKLWTQSVKQRKVKRDIVLIPRDNYSTFSIGDSVYLGLECNHDAYIVLIDEGTSGKQTIIFPNRYDIDNFVHAGITYWFPNPQHHFTFEFAGPPGTETIRAIAVHKHVWRNNLSVKDNLTQATSKNTSEAKCIIKVIRM